MVHCHQQTRFESARQLEETLMQYLAIYNLNIPQRNLGHATPTEALDKWRKTHPDLFKNPECNHPGLDSYLVDADELAAALTMTAAENPSCRLIRPPPQLSSCLPLPSSVMVGAAF